MAIIFISLDYAGEVLQTIPVVIGKFHEVDIDSGFTISLASSGLVSFESIHLVLNVCECVQVWLDFGHIHIFRIN